MKSWVFALLLGILFTGTSKAGSDSLSLRKKNINQNKFSSLSFKYSTDTSEIYQPFFRIYLGGFHAYSKSSITIHSDESRNGTDINPKKTFEHGEKKIIPRVEIILNPLKRHEIGFIYWTINRERTDTLNQYVRFRDTIFYPNTIMNSKFYFTQYELSYRYAFISNRRLRAGLSFGGKLLESDTRFRTIQNGHSYGVQKKIYAPIPLVGVHTTINISKHFSFRAAAQYLRLHRTNWYFQTIDGRAGIEYYPVKNLGIGIDYHYFDTDIQRIPSEKLNGEIEYRFSAVSIYMGLRI